MDRHYATGTRAVHVGRQPIYDIDRVIIGYELLFRGRADAVEASSQGVYATSQVLVTACTEFGLQRLVGGRMAFVNLTREFLVGELPLPFGPDQAVLEVLETVPIDDAVMAGVTELAERGYTIALDDFVVGSPAEKLLDLARYVKIDTLDVPRENLANIVEHCRRPGIRLVAERVETERDLEYAKALGFELFQGYVLSRPEVVTAPRVAPSRMNTVRMLVLLNDPATSIPQIGEMMSSDPALCYRLLTAANGAAAATKHRISSITQAATLVGTARMRQWLTLMVLADIAADEHNATNVLIHARFCQQIAEDLGVSPDAAFTAGLLDGVSALIGLPAAALIADMPLAEGLVRALVDGAGPLGRLLALARAYRVGAPLPEYRAGEAGRLAHAYLAAIDWTQALVHAA